MSGVVAVVGPGDSTDESLLDAAYDVGTHLARRGATLVCGGLGGVMSAACLGAKEHGGTTVGLLPGSERVAANPHVDIAIPTGLGQGRNLLVVRAGDVLIVVGGSWGTLSEVAMAMRARVPVVSLHGWRMMDHAGREVTGLNEAEDPAEAVALALGPTD